MSCNPKSYGAAWSSVFLQTWRDRLRGEHARANARLGYLRPPDGEGRLVWIKAGGTRDSVRLGVELMGAIRQKRHDLRLVLTFEEDYADILEPRVAGMRKIGLGFGPCDRPAAVRRTWQRFEPFGVILVDSAFPEHLARRADAAGAHLLAFNTAPGQAPVEAAYPVDVAQAAAWEAAGTAGYVAAPADPHSLFVEAQVDTTLRSLVTGGEERELWWWQGPPAEAGDFIRHWRESALADNGVLFVSADGQAAPADAGADLQISEWQRQPLAAGSVVWLDDMRWTGAVASAIHAGHLAQAEQTTLWSALAGGSAISIRPGLSSLHAALAKALQQCEDTKAVLALWAGYREAPAEGRRQGDACRRLFWEERRTLQKTIDEFLQRIFDW